jgi:hypothetical protein
MPLSATPALISTVHTHAGGDDMDRLRLALGIASLVALIAGCAGAASPTTGGSTPVSSADVPATGGQSAGGVEGFEGSLVTSGGYDATWTVSPDQGPDPFNSSDHPTLVSDKGTAGNIRVMDDGSVSFGSGAPELSGQYAGTGAVVTLDETGQFVCSFSVDTDLSSGESTLHIAGTMTVHWHPEGLGGLNCP